MSTKKYLLVVITAFVVVPLISTTSELSDCEDQGITFTSEPTDVKVCETETAIFHCQYEGSVALPMWSINSMLYSTVSLPSRYFFTHDHTLSVISLTLGQNNTLYQCQVISLTSSGQICAYSGWLIVVICTGITSEVQPTSTSNLPPSASATQYLTSIRTVGPTTSEYSTVERMPSFPLVTVLAPVGIVIFLLGIALLVIPIGVCLFKRNKSRLLMHRTPQQENIYEGPTSSVNI